jgi:hemerythrin-like domain-containing protein
MTMKTATMNLEDDHVYVLKLTDVMRAIAGSEIPEVNHVGNVVEIIRNFADGLHHAKEENIFFPALGEKGFSAQQGPVAVMLHEHVQGRDFVRGIADNLDLLKKGNKEAIAGIKQNMLGYADLLVNHISKENNILFRMADKVLSAEEQSILFTKFEEIEKNLPAGGGAGDYMSRINALAEIYKV